SCQRPRAIVVSAFERTRAGARSGRWIARSWTRPLMTSQPSPVSFSVRYSFVTTISPAAIDALIHAPIASSDSWPSDRVVDIDDDDGIVVQGDQDGKTCNARIVDGSQFLRRTIPVWWRSDDDDVASGDGGCGRERRGDCRPRGPDRRRAAAAVQVHRAEAVHQLPRSRRGEALVREERDPRGSSPLPGP